jgi:hypothetical protein
MTLEKILKCQDVHFFKILPHCTYYYCAIMYSYVRGKSVEKQGNWVKKPCTKSRFALHKIPYCIA